RTARAKETHPATDSVRVSLERVLCRRVLGGQKTAAGRVQDRGNEHRSRPLHKRFLPCAGVFIQSSREDAPGKYNRQNQQREPMKKLQQNMIDASSAVCAGSKLLPNLGRRSTGPKTLQ